MATPQIALASSQDEYRDENGEVVIPKTLEGFIEELRRLFDKRKQRHVEGRKTRNMAVGERTKPRRRRSLSSNKRDEILNKTGRKCHICGGKVQHRWEADHVLAYSAGGENSAENYLPAHGLCNNYRWDYEVEEFQWILKIGVWARTLMQKSSPPDKRSVHKRNTNAGSLGHKMARSFFNKEKSLSKRRKRKGRNSL